VDVAVRGDHHNPIPQCVGEGSDMEKKATERQLTAASSRQEIEAVLTSKPWFEVSSPEIKKLLLGLPGSDVPAQNCNGYLAHLANRPTVAGGVKVRKINDVLIPPGRIFGIFTNIEVEKVADAKVVFCYQYFSWRQGPESGAKGLVLIKGRSGKVTHGVMLNGYSFAVGADTPDMVGGFAEANETGVKGFLKNFTREMCEELGVPDLVIEEVMPLGNLLVDRGMTNNCPAIYGATIDAASADKIPLGQWKNPDPYEMSAVPNIVPIEKFWGPTGLVATSNDAYFLACVARLVANGTLKVPQ